MVKNVCSDVKGGSSVEIQAVPPPPLSHEYILMGHEHFSQLRENGS